MSKKTGYQQVGEFHRVYSHPLHTRPQIPDTKTAKLRLALILEEFIELSEAMLDESQPSAKSYLDKLNASFSEIDSLTDEDMAVDLVEVADALTDINYVTYGAGHCFGVDLDVTMEEVQRSNMSKLGADGKPIYSEQGKVLKGPNYEPPNLKKILDELLIQAEA